MRGFGAGRLGPSALALLVAVAALLPVISNDYVVGLAITSGIFIISGMGLNVIVGYAGQFCFGQAAFFGVGAYAAGLLMTREDWAFVPSLAVATVAGGAVAFVLGLLTLRLRGVFFAIATLAAAQIMMIVATNWTSLTNGASGIPGIPQIAGGNVFLWFVLGAIVVLYVGTELVRTSADGRALDATRESGALAESVGIDTESVRRWAFVACGAIAGFAGAIYASYVGALTPTVMEPYYSALPLLIVMLGGRGITAGPIVGGIALLWLPQLLNLVGTTRLIVLGVALIVVTLFAPAGILSIRFGGWRPGRRSPSTPAAPLAEPGRGTGAV
jgi:branched-chain amino acid transport system permease protein